jgi:hypothetical protein
MSQPRRSFYVILPVFAVLLTLLLAELAFSLIFPVPFSLEKNMYFEPNSYTGYRHRPNAVGAYLNGVEAMANSRGHRDEEVVAPKPDGTFRILMIGDSFTVGANVEQAEAFPQVLERLLSQNRTRSVEVVNAGTGGWSPFQYAQYLEHYGDELQPDLILVGFFVGNDSYVDRFRVEDTLTAVLGRRVSREKALGWWGVIKVFLYEHSHIARLTLTQSLEQHNFNREHCGDFNAVYLGLQERRLENHIATPSRDMQALLRANVTQIASMGRWSEQRGIPMAVFLFPDESQVNPLLRDAVVDAAVLQDYDFNQPQAALRVLFAEESVDWVDLLGVVRADERCLYMNDSHWIAAGHELVAEQMAKYLHSQNLPPE